MADAATITYTAYTSLQVTCRAEGATEDDLNLFVQNSEDAASQVVGHLIYVHGWTKQAAVAEAEAWVVTPATATHEGHVPPVP